MKEEQDVAAGDPGPGVHLDTPAGRGADFGDIRPNNRPQGGLGRVSVYNDNLRLGSVIGRPDTVESAVDAVCFMQRGNDDGYPRWHRLRKHVRAGLKACLF